MSRYLSALKISENVEGTNLKNLKNPLEGSSLGFLGTPPPPFEIDQAANDDTDPAENVAHFAWLIHFADREPVTVTFSPIVNHAGALACYPDAVAAEPIPDTPSRTPTAEESAHLVMLMMAIYGDDWEGDRNEALQVALVDPDNALTCYTVIASERGLILTNDDDRRTCRQCASLHGVTCTLATPGGALSAKRGYTPGELWQDEPHRCEGFSERGAK